jgi:hypothetical protein
MPEPEANSPAEIQQTVAEARYGVPKTTTLKLASRGAFKGDTSSMDASLARGRPVVVGHGQQDAVRGDRAV